MLAGVRRGEKTGGVDRDGHQFGGTKSKGGPKGRARVREWERKGG